MRKTVLILLASMVIPCNCLWAQDNLPGRVVTMMEDMALAEDLPAKHEELAWEISALINDPVNINSGSVNEINRLFFLTAFQVQSIIDYSSEYGNILSAMELSYIPGFDTDLAALMKNLVSFGQNSNKPRYYRRNLKIMTDYSVNSDTPDKNAPGSTYKLRTRAWFEEGRFRASVITDKDRGEKLLSSTGEPDFISGNVVYSPGGPVEKIIIGDYKVKFGQGLTAWNGFSYSSVPSGLGLMKGSSRIQASQSSDENDFFRGAVMSARFGKINIMAFASLKMRDATTGNDEENNTAYIKSFYTTGLHNTTTSLLKKDAVYEESYGFNFNATSKRLYLGLNAVGSRLSLPVIPSKGLRNQYDFAGNKNYLVSADYTLLLKYTRLYGELALSNNAATAFLQGLALNPEGRIKCNVLYARVNRGYNSLYGKAAGHGAFNKHFSSIMGSLSGELADGLSFSAGLSYRKDLWFGQYSGDFPFSLKYLLRISYDAPGLLKLRADLRHGKSHEDITPERGVRLSGVKEKTGIRFTAGLQPTELLSLRTRIEGAFIAGSPETGFMCYQSAALKMRRLPLEARIRLALFNTGSYDTRIYAWEDDLLWNMSVRPLYMQGYRSYMVLTYKPSGRISIRAKYGVTRLRDEGDLPQREFKAQLILDL